MTKQTFEEKGDGYLLSYKMAMDNSFRTEFFKTKEEAEARAQELKDKEYIGLNSIPKVQEYYEWQFEP